MVYIAHIIGYFEIHKYLMSDNKITAHFHTVVAMYCILHGNELRLYVCIYAYVVDVYGNISQN